MDKEYTAVIKKDNDWWIEEVSGVNCQEPTKDKLIETLKITLREALEFYKKDALSIAGDNFIEEKIKL